MKISISSWCFNQLFVPKSNVTQYNATIYVKRFNADAIEYTTLVPHNKMTKKEYARQLNSHAKHIGIDISAYLVGANLAQTDESQRKEEVRKVLEELDIAAELGVKLFRHDVCFSLNDFRSFDQALPVFVKSIKEITKYGESLGIKTMTENHGMICQDSDRMEKLVSSVDHPNFGLLCDMGNFMCVDEDPVTAVSRLMPYTFLVHAKDFMVTDNDIYTNWSRWHKTRAGKNIIGTALGEGVAPVKQCIKAIKNSGYDGYITLEYEGELSPEKGVQRGVNNLKKWLDIE